MGICICIQCSGRDRDADLPSTDSSDKSSLRNDAEPPDTRKMQASSVAFCCFLVIQRKYPIFFLVQVFSSHLVTRCEHSGGARGQQQRLGQRHGWHVIWSGRNKKIENAWRQHHEKTTRRQVEHQESVVPEMVKQCLWTLFLLSCSTLSLSSISASAPSDLQACRGTRCPPGCSR